MENFDNVLVIDADGHVYEGNVDLAPRMPEKWRSQAPIRLKDNEGNSRILLEGRLWSASQGLAPGCIGSDDRQGARLSRRHGRSRRPAQRYGRGRHRCRDSCSALRSRLRSMAS